MMNGEKSPRKRAGYSLIEVVVVIGAVWMIMSLCGLILHGMFRLDRAGRRSILDTSTIARLSNTFREDVHSAASLNIHEFKDGTMSLELVRASRSSLSYSVEGLHLIRAERDGKAQRSRESFAIERLDPVRFEREGRLVRLRLDRAVDDPTRPVKGPIRIEAVLGRDRSLGIDEEAR